MTILVLTDPMQRKRVTYMTLRAKIMLHIKVPAFRRNIVLSQCRMLGYQGRTLNGAVSWINKLCDEVGLARDAGLPASSVTPRT